MRTISIATALGAMVLATAAFAADTDFKKVDADASGTLTMAEVNTAMPNVTQAQFKAADTDGDGLLSEAEWVAATR
ncbi:MAG: hypothetical protein ACR2PM_07770 [Hyphomicrobiales bacterium]